MNGDELSRVLNVHKVMARAYADDRLHRVGICDMRSFVIAAAWVFTIERPRENYWVRVAELVRIRPESLWLVFSDDAPRFQPPQSAQPRECEAAVLKRGKEGVCGRRGTHSFRVTDPSDGTWRTAAYCTRHEAEAKTAFAAEQQMRRSRIIPEPDANTGGLLPCYFRWDWESCYAQAVRGWKPPRLGIRADDWPVMARAVPVRPARLTLVAGAGEDVVPGRPEGAGPLTVVGDGR